MLLGREIKRFLWREMRRVEVAVQPTTSGGSEIWSGVLLLLVCWERESEVAMALMEAVTVAKKGLTAVFLEEKKSTLACLDRFNSSWNLWRVSCAFR